jgi:hypothetical protein
MNLQMIMPALALSIASRYPAANEFAASDRRTRD